MADHRADVDDTPAALLAHDWQHRFDHTDDTEQVRIELGLDIGDAALLDCADLGIACVVDQDIDPPCLFKQLLDGCFH